MRKIYTVIGACVILLSSCSGTEIESKCDNIFSQIFQSSYEIYPYEADLEALIFANQNSQEFIFEVIEFNNEPQSVFSSSASQMQETFEHQLYCSELDIYLRLNLCGKTSTANCPDSIFNFNMASVRAPLRDVAISDPQQLGLNMSIFVENDIPVVQQSFLDSLTINNETYFIVHRTITSEFEMYYNFEYGVVGMSRASDGLVLNFKDVVY